MTSHERHAVSNHQLDYLFHNIFGVATNKTSNLHIAGPLRGDGWPVDFPHKGLLIQKASPCHGVNIINIDITLPKYRGWCWTNTSEIATEGHKIGYINSSQNISHDVHIPLVTTYNFLLNVWLFSLAGVSNHGGIWQPIVRKEVKVANMRFIYVLEGHCRTSWLRAAGPNFE